MHATARRLRALVVLALVGLLAIPTAAAAQVSKPGGPFVPPNQETVNLSATMSFADVEKELLALERRSKGALRLEIAGYSGEGRPLYVAYIGTGPQRMWVQGRIHGNEPYGPDAALAFLKTLVAGGAKVREVLDEMTFAVIPMFNPDGSEAYIRQDTVNRIDLNRDWGVDERIFGLMNEARVARGLSPRPQSTYDNYTRYRAVESQAFWYEWAEFKPHYILDIHHQGTYFVDDTNEMTTFSIGISVDPHTITGAQWDTVRQMAVAAGDAAGRRGTVNVTQYQWLNIPEGMTSATMMNAPGPNGEYADWTSNSIFFESRGGIGTKSRGYLIGQNVDGLWGVVDAIVDGSLDSIDPARWDDIPPRGRSISTRTRFPNQFDW